VTSAQTPPQDAQVTATATCPGGTVLLGGGGKVTASGPAELSDALLWQSYPSSSTTWTAVGIAEFNLPAGQTFTVQAFVVCTG
jgi:hypothetical protein